MASAESLVSPYFTIAQAADWSGYCPKTVRRWIGKGLLRRYGQPGKWLVLRAELEAFLAPKPDGEGAA